MLSPKYPEASTTTRMSESLNGNYDSPVSSRLHCRRLGTTVLSPTSAETSIATRMSEPLNGNYDSPVSSRLHCATVSSPTSSEISTATRTTEHGSSNTDSSASSPKSEPREIQGQDVDFNSKVFVNELFECGLKEERFRIDRKKLEDMLQTQQNSNGTVENAEVFFQRVMLETATLISWPSKLKIGAKSKKDPHVKIVGKPEAVQLAKEKVLEVLDTKKNRVTLKMDVSHADHSYIIGKGGFKIQQVMEETGCHIHFPDSNRNSLAEKSNQVSIAGQATGVELARAKIRELLPLVFTFELPNGEAAYPGQECSPAIQHIQQTYSFNVTFRPIGPPGMGRTLLVVRGSQRVLSRLRQGLALLMKYLTGSEAIPVMGFMKTEIAAQHHQFVMGPCNANSQMIMNKTGATIIFPDSSTFGSDSPTQSGPLISGLSKSTVIIQGSFDGVCLAWQELLKCLPLVLMFDLKEGQELDSVMVNNFMECFNINIMVRPKIKENTKSVLIRGAEKDSKILFQVRKEILGLDDDSGSMSPSEKQTSVQVSTERERRIVRERELRKLYVRERRMPQEEAVEDIQKPAQNMSTAESLSLLSNIIQQNPQIVGLLSNLSTAFPSVNAPDVLPHPTLPNPVYRAVPNSVQQIPLNQCSTKKVENWINRLDRGYTVPPGASFPNYLQKEGNFADDGDSGIFVSSRTRFQNGLETRSDLSSQPESSASSTSSNETPDFKTNAFSKKMPRSNDSTAGVDIHQLLAEYDNMKINASRAMHKPIGEGARTPNQLWSGYGFSKSVPDFAARAKRASQNAGSISEFLDMENSKATGTTPSKAWTSDLFEKCDSPFDQASPFSFSNFWENLPQKPAINYGAIKTVDQLLNFLDLEKYSELLNHHEIDLPTFLSLSDMDLQQLGISYGARSKMLTAISAIRDHKLEECSLKNFRAAPGAERRRFWPRCASGSAHEENDARI